MKADENLKWIVACISKLNCQQTTSTKNDKRRELFDDLVKTMVDRNRIRNVAIHKLHIASNSCQYGQNFGWKQHLNTVCPAPANGKSRKRISSKDVPDFVARISE
eukprot:CAMPEP_0169286758 /NCGR_PEP_ID=MMETSP1016-20121227/59493_1 /TAXON_ID=342587 /ORGANISM="Karlodinium micrum, Strain CCMP2283" /LENGTH=104 /DNA_ID=CAMNT_0009376535 /DNA_START=214 /DNA_END=528 /DNA_ORIENTATION=+